MSDLINIPPPTADSIIPAETCAEMVVSLWLSRHSALTRQAYAADVAECLKATGCIDVRQITLPMLQTYADSLKTFAVATQCRKLAAIKSLLSFAQQTGWHRVNVGTMIRPPKQENRLAERIIDADDVARLLALETHPRNHAMLTLLYRGGLRISEVAGLQWRHVVPRENGAQIAVHGKGSKTRFVLIGAKLDAELAKLRPEGAAPDAPVFISRSGDSHMTTVAIHNVVKAAAKRIGREDISAHWLRHSHASHALDNGAPVHLVQQTLGHASLTTTSKYAHARPCDSSERYLGGK